ncbi:MAG: hypothetical protein ACKN8X_01540 [Candidatus Methylopumilus sp.]
MSGIKSNAFTLAYTFFREPAEKVIPELRSYGFSGINLALNYHSSRDLLLRQGPQLAYLSDGFHYYQVNDQAYEPGAIKPEQKDQLPTNQVLDSVLKVAKENDFEVNAWAVYMHNSAIGMAHPDSVVTNALGNKFFSELCPSNPAVAKYAVGMSKDLASRGIDGIRAESLHFHGARHGEHHERFFIELSPITEFLFALCFCNYCKQNFEARNEDVDKLISKVAKLLLLVFEDKDPWLGKQLNLSNLAEVAGEQILKYLKCREEAVTNLYRQISEVTSGAKISFNFVDQAPLLDFNSQDAISNSWQVGIDNSQIVPIIDRYEPLIYRRESTQVAKLAENYLKNIAPNITAILRPTYPDCTSANNLSQKVDSLVGLGIREIDFYLLDTMRKSDLNNIKSVITS